MTPSAHGAPGPHEWQHKRELELELSSHLGGLMQAEDLDARYPAVVLPLHLPRHKVAQPAAARPPLLLPVRFHRAAGPVWCAPPLNVTGAVALSGIPVSDIQIQVSDARAHFNFWKP